MEEHTALVFAAILVTAAVCQWIAWRVKLPGILFLLVVGILAGPVSGLLDPEKLMGGLFFPFVSLSVALILFEGSLTLNFREIKGLEAVVRNMVSYGMLITWAITAVAARVALGLSWEICILLGAITSVSGPTVIVPMLRTVRPRQSIANILRWEGILIDPVGAAMAVLVYEFIISGAGQQAVGHTLFTFFKLISVGAATGILAGYLFGLAIRRRMIPQFLHNLTAIAAVIAAFAASNLFQHESGLVSVTVMGVWMANMEEVKIGDILDFKEHISILLISVLFILLAARIDIHALLNLGWRVIFLFAAIQFLARPLNIMVSTIGSHLPWPERHMLAWIAPRGIVAAAISALFAVQLEKAGFSDASILVPVTFFIIISTVVLQSLTARPIAKWLKVAEKKPNGFIIIGANTVARSIGKALSDQGIQVLLADTGWDHVAKAKLEGLPCYFGNPVSAHAEKHISLLGMKGILALSPHDQVNAAAALHFKVELGPDHIYIISTRNGNPKGIDARLSSENQGHSLFSRQITFARLASILSQDGQIITTKLTEKFGFDRFTEKHRTGAICLFALDPDKNIHVFSDESPVIPRNGWSLTYLLKSAPAESPPAERKA